MPRPIRFWERLVLVGECWIFTGAKNEDGYGKVKLDGHWRAHRYAWSVLRGEIPDGLELDHLCRNRACVNPDHLDPVPGAVNTARASKATYVGGVQVRCLRDHEFTPENTRMYRGKRQCRACQRLYKARAQSRA